MIMLNVSKVSWLAPRHKNKITTKFKLLTIDGNEIKSTKNFFMFLTNVVPKVSTLV